MELHHRSCILPSNAPALPDTEAYIPSRVLQERSANRVHEYSDGSLSRKRSPSYAGRLDGYFTGNLGTYFQGDRSEAQVEIETRKLLKLLKKCDKYQKYRERQRSDSAEKDQTWPDSLEEAFWRALVRYLPMGRRKKSQHGQLRGRNELVAESIQRETGEPRTRKQVSSHIQVLKPMLSDQPQILVYMSTEDMSSRSSRGRHVNSHFRHRHASSKYGVSESSSVLHHSLGYLPSSVALARLQSTAEHTLHAVANFDMFVEAANVREHTFSQISNSRSRLDDLHVLDTMSWQKQYPEFKFHQANEFRERHVLICDATIKVMSNKIPPRAELKITFDLVSQNDLCVYDSIECRTCFFENGKPAGQPDGEMHTQEEYFAKHGVTHVHFGSGFWVQKMRKLGDLLGKASAQEELSARTSYEERVRGELQNLTASQDIYGMKDGEEECLLTILWRFSQTRTSNDPGRMTWRVANFGHSSQRWIKEEEMEQVCDTKDVACVSYTKPSLSLLPMETPSHPNFSHFPLDYSHSFCGNQSTLDLDVLEIEGITESGFSQPTSAPSLATDFSQTNVLQPVSRSHDAAEGSQAQELGDANEFDFNSGHLTISGCLEPAINLDAYESYGASQISPNPSISLPLPLSTLSSLSNPLSSLEQQGLSDLDLCSLANISASLPASCYATKPSWQHPSLISHLESAAEQFGVGDLISADDGQGGLLGEGVLWKLQEDFGADDTGMGAERRRDSKVGGVVGFDESERGVWTA